MTDIIISSFLSLFALFGKEEKVDEVWAKTILANYLRRHFGIRNIEHYLNLYSDLRGVYEISENLDTNETVTSICSNLLGKITPKEKALLLLRLMEFCSDDGVLLQAIGMFKTMAKIFNISDELYQDFSDFVENKENRRVMIHKLEGTDGKLKTLACPSLGLLIFTYNGTDTVLLNDVPVLPGAFMVWLQSSVIKGKKGNPIYFSTIVDKYAARDGKALENIHRIEFCGRDINFRFPNSDNGIHNLSFNLHHGELLAIMGGSGTGKSTLLSLLNGTLVPQEGSITINGHSISEPRVKDLIGFVPQDDLLIEELTVYQNLWFTAKLCFEGMSDNSASV